MFILRTESEAIAWKWVILALHGALYGFAISSLRGTNPNRVTYKTEKGKEKLISFEEAIKRAQQPRYMSMTTVSKHLELGGQQKESIRKLHKVFRDNFVHYVPAAWVIEIHKLTQIAIDCLDAARFLALDTGNYVHLNTEQEQKVAQLVDEAKEFLKKSQLFHEAEQLRC